MNEVRINENINEFIFGGNAEFTIKNDSSGKGAKYHVVKSKKSPKNKYFVYVKCGDNYYFGGTIYKHSDGNMDYYMGKGSYPFESKEIKGLVWVLRHSHKMVNGISMYHHGKCACCGRKLEDAESLRLGFGPVCCERLGISRND